MSLKDTFLEIFSPVEHEAEAVAKSLAHFIEKEITMSLPQEITDVIARIKALISGASDRSTADAKTISDLNAQLADCKTLDAQKDAQVADLTSQLSDATSQLSDIEQQLLALSPVA